MAGPSSQIEPLFVCLQTGNDKLPGRSSRAGSEIHWNVSFRKAGTSLMLFPVAFSVSNQWSCPSSGWTLGTR